MLLRIINKKRALPLIFIFYLIVSFTFVSFAAAEASDGIAVYLDGKELEFDVPPRIENERTLVPLRVIFESLGAEVQWDNQTRTVTAYNEQARVTLQIGNKNAFRNSDEVEMDVPAILHNGRTLVPLRFVSEALGALVDWDESTRIVTIKSPEEEKDLPDPEVDRGYPSSVTPIVGEPLVTLEQAKVWAADRDAHPDFVEVAELYWEIGIELGIRPEIAYAQSAKETCFGRFTGVVPREYHNWCGLKTYEGGPCDEPESHACFPDDRFGVTAHYHHLMTYAGVEIEGEILSPRSRGKEDWRFGIAPTVEDLGGSGRWAPSSNYGKSIVWDFLELMKNTLVN